MPPQIDHNRVTVHHNNDHIPNGANSRPARFGGDVNPQSPPDAPSVIYPRMGLLERAASNQSAGRRIIDINEAVVAFVPHRNRPLRPFRPQYGPRIIEIENDQQGSNENGSTGTDPSGRTSNVQSEDSTQRSHPNQEVSLQTEHEPITFPMMISSHPEFQPRPPHLNPHYKPEQNLTNQKPPQCKCMNAGPKLSFEHGPRVIDLQNLKELRRAQRRIYLHKRRVHQSFHRAVSYLQLADQNQQHSQPDHQRASINQQRSQQNQQRSSQHQQRLRPNQQLTGLHQQCSRPGQQHAGTNQQRSQPNQKPINLNQQSSRPVQQHVDTNQQRSRHNQQPTGVNQPISRPGHQRACTNQQRSRLNQLPTGLNQQISRPGQQRAGTNQQRSQPNQQPTGLNRQSLRSILSFENGPRGIDFPNVKKRNKTEKYINPREAIDENVLNSFFSRLPLSASTNSTWKVLDLYMSSRNEKFTEFMQYVVRNESPQPSGQEYSHILDLSLQPTRRDHLHVSLCPERLIQLQYAINLLPIERPFLDLRLVLARLAEIRRIETLNSRNRQQFSRILDFTDDSNVTIEQTNYFRRFNAGTSVSQNLFQPWMMVLPTQIREDVHREQEVNPNRPMIFDMSSEPFYIYYNQRLMDNIVANPTTLFNVLQEIQNRARRMRFENRRPQ